MFEQPYTFRQFVFPSHLQGGMQRWIECGIFPGGFLTAVLRNDLKSAVSQADDVCLANLPAISAFLYNEAPYDCYGSPERVNQWAAQKGIVRERKP